MIKDYLILCLAVLMLYYSLFKFDKDKNMKRILLVASFLGIFVSTAGILGGYFPSLKSLIEGIFLVPIIIGLSIFFFFLIKYVWPLRKHPTLGIMVYVGFGCMILGVLILIIIFVLYQV